MTDGPANEISTGYKAWVFGSKLVGVLTFAVGIEMLARGSLGWAALLLFAGAAIVVAPISSPERWNERTRRRT
ncbi:MAG: hypothetical protein JSW25_08330 [Thermoplasmata archaeon]|nr:MAG: hypothetical protein JSW25_08330 [Thermoplasmata archaeon]